MGMIRGRNRKGRKAQGWVWRGNGETQRMETGERNDGGEGMRMTVGNWRMARRRRWRGEAERAKRSGGG